MRKPNSRTRGVPVPTRPAELTVEVMVPKLAGIVSERVPSFPAVTLKEPAGCPYCDEIVKLGLHAVPPGETDNVIIANITPSKIGKKSSDNDMKNLATGKPVAKKLDEDKTFDLLIPVTDAKGRDIDGGFVVMEVPFAKANSEEEAIKIGVAIRDDIQKQIPSKKALYQ